MSPILRILPGVAVAIMASASLGASGPVPTEAQAPELLSSCQMGERHPGAPEELDQFAFLIGNWDVTFRRAVEDGGWSEPLGRAYWEGRWVLGGMAIADFWYDIPPPRQHPQAGRGMNVRMFDEENDRWSNMWQHSKELEVRTLFSKVEGDGRMHMWASHPDTSDRRRIRSSSRMPTSGTGWKRAQRTAAQPGNRWPGSRHAERLAHGPAGIRTSRRLLARPHREPWVLLDSVLRLTT